MRDGPDLAGNWFERLSPHGTPCDERRPASAAAISAVAVAKLDGRVVQPVAHGTAETSSFKFRAHSVSSLQSDKRKPMRVDAIETADVAERLIGAARRLRDAVQRLQFAPPVSHVYNPLDYAWAAHEEYLRRYANSRRRAVFLGMNPGPFGMVQTGVPFGEVGAVRDWLGINLAISAPGLVHPKRPITGFDCPRMEISGQRLWGLFAARFGSADAFFESHFVVNYCPLAFLEASGCNRTPDKLAPAEKEALFRACDEHLREVIAALAPEWLIGIGDFAAKRAREVFADGPPKIARVLHPSPASPAANRDWAGAATRELERLGIWSGASDLPR